LRPGDRLRTASGTDATVVGLRHNVGQAVVYTLTVARDHTYFVSSARVLVHNCSSPLRDPDPGSPEHKALRWQAYQNDPDNAGWDYKRWSSVYESNMHNADTGNAGADAVQQELGWGTREVTGRLEGDPFDGVTRRHDIADVDVRRAREVKTGYQYVSPENLSEIARDEHLIERMGWSIRWRFLDSSSQPLQDALANAGIPFDIQPLQDPPSQE